MQKYFKLTKEEKTAIRKIIKNLKKVLDKINEIDSREDVTPQEIYSYLREMDLSGGLCAYLDNNNIWGKDRISENVMDYFKRKVVPYTAYWCAPPRNIIRMDVSDREKCNMLKDSIRVRYENLCDALKLFN